MIRRWSAINYINYSHFELPNFVAYQHIKIFRRSIKFKRYYIGVVHFTRRHIRKLKHRANWALYYNVFKYWTDSIRIARQYYRFQYHYRFFVNNFIAVHGNTFIRHRDYMYVRQKQWVGSTLTRCLFITFGGDNSIEIIQSHRGGHHASIFFPSLDINADVDTTPTLAFFDKQGFAKNFELDSEHLELCTNYSFLSTIIFSQHKELYQILIILWFVLNLNINV